MSERFSTYVPHARNFRIEIRYRATYRFTAGIIRLYRSQKKIALCRYPRIIIASRFHPISGRTS